MEEKENLVTLTRGCVLKMYHTQNFKIESLKALFWNELPAQTNPVYYTITVRNAFTVPCYTRGLTLVFRK